MRAFSLKCGVLLAAVAGAVAQAAEPSPWQTNLETAQRLAAQTNRLVLIHFWAPRCRPCLRLEKEVLSDPEMTKALEANFVLVKLNADDAPGTTRMYGVSTLPTDVITTPQGRLVSQIQSPPSVAQYVAQMNRAAVGHRSLARNPAPPEQAPQPEPPKASPPPPNSGAATAVTQAEQGNIHLVAATEAAGNDRYAEYFQQQQVEAPDHNYVARAQAFSPSPQPPAGGPQPPAVQQQASGMQQQAPQQQPMAQQPVQHAYASGPPMAAPQPAVQLPPGCPPVALDGHCPLTLMEQKRWVLGDKAFGVVHRGRTYLFLGPNERQKFLADPDRFAPVLSGVDPVLALDHNQVVAGRREFGVFGADGHIYLFADPASRDTFEKNEQYYAQRARSAMQGPREARLQGPAR